MLDSQTQRGMAYALCSAVIFGFTPVLTRLSYEMGNNGVNATFLRGLFSLPFLYWLSRREKTKASPKGQWFKVIICGFLAGITTLLLYSSYGYINSGTATMLHFVYPLGVIVLSCICYGKRPRSNELMTLGLGLFGVSLFVPNNSVGTVQGILMALCSGLTYAGYIMMSSNKDIKSLPPFTLIFRITVLSTCIAGGYGLISGSLTLALPLPAFVLCLLIALLDSLVGGLLLQWGIRLAGERKTSLLSLLEPLTGIICGILIFHDSQSSAVYLGCLLITGSLWLTLVNH